MTQTVEELFGCIATQFGIATGEAIKTEISALLGLPNVDVGALQAAITQIQTLLDADPDTEGFQVGQNIITSLTDLASRISALENDSVVATLQSLVTSLEGDLAAEISRAQAAEEDLQSQIDALATQLAGISVSIENPSDAGACDCVALQEQITALGNAVTNLQSADAAFAVQITALQDNYAAVSAQVAANATAVAAAAAAAVAAQGTANSAAAAAATNAAAIQALDVREAAADAAAAARITTLEAFKANVLGLDCMSLRAAFAGGIVVGKSNNV
jgi:chromosome segregation ATPase